MWLNVHRDMWLNVHISPCVAFIRVHVFVWLKHCVAIVNVLCGYCPCIVWLLSMYFVAIVHVFVWLFVWLLSMYCVAIVHVFCGYCPCICVAITYIVWLLSMYCVAIAHVFVWL